MNSIEEFVKIIIAKYISEMIVSVMCLYILRLFFRTKFTSILIAISYFFNFKKLEKALTYNIEKHKVYNSIESLIKNQIFTKHIKNKDYKEYGEIILQALFYDYSDLLNKNLKELSRDSFLNSQDSISKKLSEYTNDIKTMQTYRIRQLAADGQIDNRFSRKFLVFFEYHYETMVSRINSELKKSENSYVVLIDYLYIVNDYLSLFRTFFPFIINNINGNIKQKIYTEDEVVEIIERIN